MLGPEVKGLAGKLGTVIDGDSFGKSAGKSQPLQHGHDRSPAKRGIDRNADINFSNCAKRAQGPLVQGA